MPSKTNKSLHPAIKILESYKKLVWPEIKRYLKDPPYPTAFQIPKNYQKDILSYWKIVNEYPKRQGKYLRPTLLLLTAGAMGQKPKLALKTAAAMQLSEDWLLIHDDFQDHSLIRRGKPTLHKMFGSELAVNAGDTLHAIMWKVLIDNQNVLGKKKALDLANEFYKILKRTADGQAIEIMWSKGRKTAFRNNDWFFIADGKTAYYSIAGPMRLGAMIANANERQLRPLTEFGLHLGRCFQLVDDLLDLTSAYKGIGHQIGSDVYEGKRTIILSHLIRKANQIDKKRILSILKKTIEKKTEKEVKWIIEKMHYYGSIDYTKMLAQEFKEKAQKIFEKDLKFLTKQPARKHLEQIIEFILERDY